MPSGLNKLTHGTLNYYSTRRLPNCSIDSSVELRVLSRYSSLRHCLGWVVYVCFAHHEIFAVCILYAGPDFAVLYLLDCIVTGEFELLSPE